MKKSLVILLILLFSVASSYADKKVNIEMLNLQGEWGKVIIVHGYGSNEAAAKEIILGLNIVSEGLGNGVRTYRITK
tara:strand:+ start:558 stop:788 length:231 start_codon:yes stop_codon:yes gene_type:complete